MTVTKPLILSVVATLALPCLALAGGNGYFIGLPLVDSGPEPASPRESAAISASASVGSARDQLHRLAIGLSRQFESSSDYRFAELVDQEALTHYELAKAAALQTIRSTARGVSDEIDIERLERQLDDARQAAKFTGTDHSAQIDALAMQLLQKRTAISHREAAALASNDALNNLRYAWLDANSTLMALREGLGRQIQSDPQWRSAKAGLEQARTALACVSE